MGIDPQEAFKAYVVKHGPLQNCSRICSVEEISIHCIYLLGQDHHLLGVSYRRIGSLHANKLATKIL